MSYFKELDEGQVAILVENGVFKQVPLFTRNGYLFAKVGSGFVRLAHDGSTSKTSVRIEALVCDIDLQRNAFGHLCDGSVTGAKPIEAPRRATLLGHADG